MEHACWHKKRSTCKTNFYFTIKKKNCELLLKLLWNEGFILGYSITKNNKKIKIFLKYANNKPVINSITLLSKPSKKIYFSAKQLSKINSNNLFVLFSTNKGLKSIKNCKKLKLGGKPFIAIK